VIVSVIFAVQEAVIVGLFVSFFCYYTNFSLC